MADDNQVPWEGQLTMVNHYFALKCRELRESDPYRDSKTWEPALTQIMTHLATELWDQTFSQTEIAEAMRLAVERLRPYAAGEGRRGDKKQ